MNNMYDILAKFNSVSKTTLTENVDPVAFAALAPPRDKITFADKIAGAKKEVDEMLGDVAAEAMKKAVVGLKDEAGMEEGSTGDYSAKKARAGKDIGKPGKQFAKIAKSAGERYGSKERGEKVAGAVLAKLRGKNESKVDEIIDVDTLNQLASHPMAGTMAAAGGAALGGAIGGAVKKAGDWYTKRKEQKALDARMKPQGVNEADMEEGNDFTAARLAAIKAGKPTFRVGGKVYKVTGDTSDERKQVDELDVNLIKAAQKHSKEHPRKVDPESERNIHKKYGYRTDRDDTGNDDDYDEWGNEKKAKKTKSKDEGPKKKGRPKGTGRSLGAKGPTGRSKLLSKGAIKEEGDESPEIEEAMSLLKKHGYKVSKDLEEKAVSKAQQRFMGMVHAAQKGEKPASKEVAKVAREMPKKAAKDYAKTKHAGLPEKVRAKKDESKEEVEETTVAGSVATAPAADAPKAKGKKGSIQFGKGVYESRLEESYKSCLETMLTEGISINASQGEDGKKTLTVNATDEDAVKLAQILQLAGMPQGHDYHDVCPGCGQSPCGCDEVEESLANSPDPVYANTEMINSQGEDLHKPKSTGQTTVPVLNKDAARQGVSHEMAKIREEAEGRLWKLYQKYEGQS